MYIIYKLKEIDVYYTLYPFSHMQRTQTAAGAPLGRVVLVFPCVFGWL